MKVETLPRTKTRELCDCGCGERTPLATNTRWSKGQVKGEPLCFKPGHHRRRRGLSYVARDCGHDTPCWVWLGATNYGYGIIRRGNRSYGAHIYYYEERYGLVPEGLELDHLCRNRACCNPEHVEPVTRAVNLQRGSKAKLTPDEVREIRATPGTHRDIARRFGVDDSTIAAIRRRKTWTNV